MARAGLGEGWRCLFANDVDPKKAAAYRANWGSGGELEVCDVGALRAAELPGHPDLVWGSFPCQDLSLAGAGAGLSGERSGTFHAFWTLVRDLAAQGRAPRIVAVENVCGTLSSHGGKDFEAICRAYAETGYRFGALVIDAELFVPQSRPRLFVIGVRADARIDPALPSPKPVGPFHTHSLRRALAVLPETVRRQMIWWNLPPPERRTLDFADLVEDVPDSVGWRTPAQTESLLAQMSPLHRAKVETAKRSGRRMVGGLYRRTRLEHDGVKRQRAEVRFDEVAGCLRTPAGGSSRQIILVVEGERVRSRLISARETARLMGLPDGYALPRNYTEAYGLTGDGVVVDVVRHLSRHIFEPLVAPASGLDQLAA